jgi:capsid protein
MSRRRENEALDLPLSFRSALEDYRQDFDIGGTSRYLPTPRGVNISGTGADYHYENESKFFRAIERARAYDRNNMVVGQGINRLVANLVQDGFTVDPTTGDPKIDQALKDDWYGWGEDPEQCDFEGEKTFYQMELLAARAEPVDGDIFALPLESGQLQWLEAHRCRRPSSLRRNTCIHGVNLNPDSAKRTGYFFTKEDIGPLGAVRALKDVIEIDARDEEGHRQVLHQYSPSRFSQRRGVTAFAPIALPTVYHDDIQFSALVAAQMQNCWAIIEETQQQVNPPPPRTGSDPQTGARTTDSYEDGVSRTVEGVAPGMRIRGREGWTTRGFSPTIPGPQFKEHTLMILSIISVNLDLPLVIFLLDATQTNFSGFRGALSQARIRFRVRQRQRIDQFYSPVWRFRVRQKLAKDAALRNAAKRSGINVFSHAWHPPTWSYIEPHKDISANALELATLQTSPRRQRARQGEDFDDVVPEIIDDAGKLLEAAELKAQDLNARLKPAEEFTREEVLRVFTAGGVQVSAAQEAAQEPNDETTAKDAKDTKGSAA